MKRFIAYYRVSTERQGRSGLGLEAQQKAVRDYLNGGAWELTAELTEIESGRKDDRPELEQALRFCRLYGATLIIAKLDRLSRDAHFLLGLQKAGVDFVAVDMPHANRLTVGIMAMVAEEERKAISERTKAALAAAKARGVKLGGDRGNLPRVGEEGRKKSAAVRREKAQARARDLKPIFAELEGLSLNAKARELNRRGILTPRGKTWTPVQVKSVMGMA